MISRRLIGVLGIASVLPLLAGCNSKPTPEISETCQAYLMGVKQTVAGAYPNTPAGNKLFLQQMQSIKDFADKSSVAELKESADAMFKAVQDQDKTAFAAAGQRLFDTCKKYGYNKLT